MTGDVTTIAVDACAGTSSTSTTPSHGRAMPASPWLRLHKENDMPRLRKPLTDEERADRKKAESERIAANRENQSADIDPADTGTTPVST